MKIASNKIADLIKFYHEQLSTLYDAGELQAIIELVFYHYLGLSKIDLDFKRQENLNQSDVLKLYDCCKSLVTGAPVQYVLGETEFYGLVFKVNPSVLIPRPETEELVDLIVKELGEQGKDEKIKDLRHRTEEQRLKILDIGTGSGCIPVTLKKQFPQADVFGLDISEAALETAKANAGFNHVDVTFVLADILKQTPILEDKKFDLIVSNPPYIKAEEALQMSARVINFEPQLALFVNDTDDIVFYKRIIDFCKGHLSSLGNLYVELNPLMANKVKEYALNAALFKEVDLIRDMSGKIRFLKATKQ